MQMVVTGALMAFFLLSGAASAEPARIQVEVASTEPAAVLEKADKVFSVAMTGYNAVPAQTDSDPYTTASGAYSDPDIVVARSVDLADELPFGTVIRFVLPEGNSKPPCGLSSVGHLLGLRVVADSMHSRKRNQVDVLFDHERTVQVNGKRMNPAVVLGVCKDIEIRVVGKIDIKQMPKNQTELLASVGGATLALDK